MAINCETPMCKLCGAEMELRRPSTKHFGWSTFWGCGNFPDCRFTMKAHIVYGLKDTRIGKYFYIGSTSSLESRYRGHIGNTLESLSKYEESGILNDKEKYIHELMINTGNDAAIRLEILRVFTEKKKALDGEREMIIHYIKKDHPITNRLV